MKIASKHKFSLPEAIKLQSLAMDIKDFKSHFNNNHGLDVFTLKSKNYYNQSMFPETLISFTKHSNSFYAMTYLNHKNKDQIETRKVCKNIEECLTEITNLLNSEEG